MLWNGLIGVPVFHFWGPRFIDCYVICKDSDFLDMFHIFWLHLTPVTLGQLWGQIKIITFVATDLLMLLTQTKHVGGDAFLWNHIFGHKVKVKRQIEIKFILHVWERGLVLVTKFYWSPSKNDWDIASHVVKLTEERRRTHQRKDKSGQVGSSRLRRRTHQKQGKSASGWLVRTHQR